MPHRPPANPTSSPPPTGSHAAAVLAAGRDLARPHFPVGDDDAGRLQSHPGGDRPGGRGDGLRHADRVRAGDPVGAADRSGARVGEPAGAGGLPPFTWRSSGACRCWCSCTTSPSSARRRWLRGSTGSARAWWGRDSWPGWAHRWLRCRCAISTSRRAPSSRSRSATAHSSRRSFAPGSSRSAAARWRPPARWG